MRVVRVACLALALGLSLPLSLSAAPAVAGDDHDLEEMMVETASTPAQHQALADHFHARIGLAHRAMARSPQPPSTHCTKLADMFDAQAKEYDALAAAHEAEAKQ